MLEPKMNIIPFTTPECSKYINEYLEYRARSGENLTANSPLIRDTFEINDLPRIKSPRHLSKHVLVYYIRTIAIKTGLRKNVPSIIKEDIKERQQEQQGSTSKDLRKSSRNIVALNHGFRKFVHTKMTLAKVNIEIRELLLGHSIGLSDAYYRPTPEQCLEEYLKVIDDLTINDENRLSKQVQELKENNQDSEYVIKGKLQEKEEQIKKLEESVAFLSDKFNAFLASQPGNKILYDNGNDGQSEIAVKGIELKPEINNKTIGKINHSDKKK